MCASSALTDFLSFSWALRILLDILMLCLCVAEVMKMRQRYNRYAKKGKLLGARIFCE